MNSILNRDQKLQIQIYLFIYLFLFFVSGYFQKGWRKNNGVHRIIHKDWHYRPHKIQVAQDGKT